MLDVCEDCPANSNAPDASDKKSDCTCIVGSTGPDGESCTKCVKGTYKAARGNANCESCPANYDSPVGSGIVTQCVCNTGFMGLDLGDGTCTACVIGTHKAETGRVACDGCLANSNSPAQRISLAACVCNAGYVGPAGGPCATCTPAHSRPTVTIPVCHVRRVNPPNQALHR